MPFQNPFARKKFNKKPKKLSLKEMWDLYRTLRYGLQGKKERYLLSEVISLLQNIDTESFISALRTMYGNITDSPIEASLLFSIGMKESNFFVFSDFVEKLIGSPKSRSS